MVGYTNDHVARLCRRGEIPGKLVGRTWYVDLQSLYNYKSNPAVPLQEVQKKIATTDASLNSPKTSNPQVKNSAAASASSLKPFRSYHEDLKAYALENGIDVPELPISKKTEEKEHLPELLKNLQQEKLKTTVFAPAEKAHSHSELEQVAANKEPAKNHEPKLAAVSKKLAVVPRLHIPKTALAAFALILVLSAGLTTLGYTSPSLITKLTDKIEDTKSSLLSMFSQAPALNTAPASNSSSSLKPNSSTSTSARPTQLEKEYPQIASNSPFVNFDALKQELLDYIEIQTAKSPVVVYSSPSVLAPPTRYIETVSHIYHTVTNQSDSDVSALSSSISSLANGGSLTNNSISNASIVDSTFSGLISGSTADLAELAFTSATGTSATTTNLFSTTGTFTNLFGTSADISSLAFSSATGTSASTTNFFSTNLLSDNADFTSLLADTATFDSLLLNGSTTLQDFTAANATTTALAISGEGAGIKFTGTGNHDITADSGTLRIGANTIIGNILPLDSSIDIGEAGQRFDKIYADEVNASTLVGTISGGNISAETLRVNSDNATADTEDSFVEFERGSEIPNALLRWDSTDDRFTFNSDLHILSGIGDGSLLVSGSTTLQDFTALDATTTSLFSTTARFTNLIADAINFSDLLFDNATGTNATTTNFFATTASSTNLFSSLLNVGGDALVVDSSGDVGIGTIDPIKKLDVDGDAIADQLFVGSSRTLNGYGAPSSIGKIIFGSEASDKASIYTEINGNDTGLVLEIADNPESDYIDFRGNASVSDDYVMRFVGGRLGIGTTTPAAILTVDDPAGIDPFLIGSSTPKFIVTESGNVGIGTAVPTHALTLSSGPTGIAVYNTADQTTNIERGVFQYDDNTLLIGHQRLGTGSIRPVKIFTEQSGAQASFTINRGNTFFKAEDTGTSNNGTFFDINQNEFTGNTKTLLSVSGTANQTGTASYTGLLVNVAETSVGTGDNRLLDLQVDDSSKFIVDNQGKVGIGTTTPQDKLTVSGGSIRSSNSAVGAGFFSDNSAGTDLFSLTRQNTVNNADLSISAYGGIGLTGGRTSDNAAASGFGLYVDPSNNVGIGTTTPSSRLHVSGSDFPLATLTRSTAGTAAVRFESGSTSGYVGYREDLLGLAFGFSDSGPSMFLDTLGNLGIGTTSPSEALHVSGNIRADGGAYTFTINPTHGSGPRLQLGTLADQDAFFEIGSFNNINNFDSKDRDLALYTSGNSGQLYLDTNGNIGIGTTSPDSKLHVTTSVSGGIKVENTGGTDASITLSTGAEDWLIDADGNGTSNQDALHFLYNNGASQSLTLDNNGNVGVGTTTPRSKLDVDGNVFSTGNFYSEGGNFVFGDSTSDGEYLTILDNDIHIVAGGSTRMHIDGDTGNVGIGTTSPSAKLAVKGSGIGTGDAFVVSDSNNNPKFIIQDNGFAGLGTTTPQYRLDIDLSAYSGSLGRDFFHVTSSSDNNKSTFLCSTEGATDCLGYGFWSLDGKRSANLYAGLYADNDNSDYFLDPATTGTSLAIAGKAGIGTTTPAVRLSVVANSSEPAAVFYGGSTGRGVRIGTSDYVYGGTQGSVLSFGQGVGTGNTYSFIDAFTSAGGNTGNLILNSTGGNVGIGTTTPAQELHVYGSGILSRLETTSGLATQQFIQADGNSFYTIWDEDNGKFILGTSPTAGTANIAIDSLLNNVGIGTTTPAYTLDVYGDIATKNNSYFRARNTSGNTTRLLGINSSDQVVLGTLDVSMPVGISAGGGNYPAWIESSAPSNSLYIESDGDIGFGTSTPQGGLDIYNPTGNSDLYLSVGSNDYRLVHASVDNTFRIQYNLSNYFTVNSSGKIGIGTSTPQAKLHIDGSTRTDGLLLTGLSTSGEASVTLDSTNNTGGHRYNIFSTGTVSAPDTGSLAIYDDSASGYRFVINPDGNVGIGTTTPAYKLSINSDNSTDNLFQVATTTNQGLFVIDSSGNVGVGTADPAAKLDVTGNFIADNVTTRGSFILPTNNTTLIFQQSQAEEWPASTSGWELEAHSGAVRKLYFYNNTFSNGVEFLVDGNVGIGTTTPASKLTVSGTAASGEPLVSIMNTSETTATSRGLSVQGGGNSPGEGYELRTLDAAGNVDFFIRGDGNVGIGTVAPAQKLSVAGSIVINQDAALRAGSADHWLIGQQSSDNTIDIGSTGVANDFRFNSSSGTGLMTIESGGDVGIGTTDPGYKLEVSGTGKFETGIILEDANGEGLTCGASTRGYVAYSTAFNATGYLHMCRESGWSTLALGTVGNPDIAEYVRVADESIEAGELVSIAAEDSDAGDFYDNFLVERAASYNADMVLGVVSTDPGVLLHQPEIGANLDDVPDTSNLRPLALAGRVPVKVTEENGPIQKGDYLTISPSTPGRAAKAVHSGMVFAKALGDSNGSGEVLAFIVHTYYVPGMYDSIVATVQAGISTSTASELSESMFTEASDTLREAVYALNDAIVQVFDTAIYAATGIFDKVFARSVHTDTICITDAVGETCLTRAQLDDLIANAGGAPDNSGSTISSTSDTSNSNTESGDTISDTEKAEETDHTTVTNTNTETDANKESATDEAAGDEITDTVGANQEEKTEEELTEQPEEQTKEEGVVTEEVIKEASSEEQQAEEIISEESQEESTSDEKVSITEDQSAPIQ